MFHEHLKRIRIASKKTQGELAAYLNISTQSVSKWESGQSLPSIDLLPNIAEFFQCPINAFFSEYELEIFEYIRKNAPSLEDVNDLLLTIISQLQGDSEHTEDSKNDDFEETIPVEALFVPAVYELLKSSDTISCALLQHKLQIGYALAAKIIDTLENLGILKRNTQTKKCEVQKKKIQLLEHYLH